MPIPKKEYKELKAMYDFQRKKQYNKEKLKKAIDIMFDHPEVMFEDLWSKMKDEDINKLDVLYLADSNHQWKWGLPTESNFTDHKKLHINFHPFSWTSKGYGNLVNFKSLTKEKNKELVYSFNSEINNFPQELL